MRLLDSQQLDFAAHISLHVSVRMRRREMSFHAAEANLIWSHQDRRRREAQLGGQSVATLSQAAAGDGREL